MAFIDDMRSRNHAVESTCRILGKLGCRVAARTYRCWRQANRPVAARTVHDAHIVDALLATKHTPEGLYGRRKMTHYLRRQGHQVAFCTVDRLMRQLGMNGVRRGKRVRTTVPATAADRAADLLNRDFTAPAPNTRWVADFTYVRTWAGFCYVAFIVDVFSQRIVGWHAATDKRTDLVLTPLRIALWDCDRQGHPITPGQLLHHSDAGSQGGFQWSSQHLDGGGVSWRRERRDRRVAVGSDMRIGRSGRRCGHQGDRGSISKVCSGSSGSGSPRACRASKQPLRAACRPRSERVGFATVAACHRSVWPSLRAVTCRSRSARRSRS
jgi:transposase InsO family protein